MQYPVFRWGVIIRNPQERLGNNAFSISVLRTISNDQKPADSLNSAWFEPGALDPDAVIFKFCVMREILSSLGLEKIAEFQKTVSKKAGKKRKQENWRIRAKPVSSFNLFN